MKRIFLSFLMVFVLALQSVAAAPPGNAYALMALWDDDDRNLLNKIVTFPLEYEEYSPEMYSVAVPFWSYSTAGAYANGYYYVATTDALNKPEQLVRFNLKTGENTVVGSIASLEYFINDMSFDHRTGTMWFVSKTSATASALFRINLENAAIEKVRELDRRFFTFASSFEGELYGVDFSGNFCRISPKDGAIEIGATGLRPNMMQSMEFDHGSRRLYWATTSQVSNGSIFVEQTFLAEIDPATGVATPLRKLGDDVQLLGLYIPYAAAFDDAPSSPLDFSVTPAPDGGDYAEIAWRNPSVTFGGAPLQSISRIQVMRDGEEIASIQAAPGESCTYTDRLRQDAGANHTYVVAAYNDAGRGVPVETTVFVGCDVPAAPSGVTVTRDADGNGVIRWEAPEKGLNGGYCDFSSLSYSVSRSPGETTLATGLKATEYTDRTLPGSGTYSYTVTASNKTGSGGAATSLEAVLGPNLTIPYDCAFTPEEFGEWTAIDADNDGNTWKQLYVNWLKKNSANYIAPSAAQADDWLLSHNFSFRKNAAYKIRFSIYSMKPNSFRFCLIDNGDIDNPRKVIADYPETTSLNYTTSEFEFTFTAGEDADLGLAIQCYSPAGSSTWYITDLHLEEVLPYNLAVEKLSGPSRPVAGKDYAYTVTVANRGTDTPESFSIIIADNDGKPLSSADFSDAPAPGASTGYTVRWKPMESGKTAIVAETVCEGDPVEADNRSDTFQLEVMPAGSADYIEIGSETESNSERHPFDFHASGGQSAALNIYSTSEMMEITAGRIDRLCYDYSSQWTQDLFGEGIKVWMANTDRTRASEGWIPEEEMTLVFDGTVDLPRGNGTISIPLQTTFEYTGGKLAVLTSLSRETYASNIRFPYYESPLEGNSAFGFASEYGDRKPFDFSQTGTSLTGTSSVGMTMQTYGSRLSGKVTDEGGKPLAGASLRITELNAVAESDAEGNYTIGFIPPGKYTIICSLFGFPDVSRSFTLESDGSELDIRMSGLPTFSVSGKVVTPDGSAIAGAAVKVSGYDNQQTVTDADGRFLMQGVLQSEENTLTVTKDWHTPYSVSFPLTDSDFDAGTVQLGYYTYSPVDPQMNPSDSGMQITWSAPGNDSHLRFDSGKAASQLGMNDDGGHVTIGTVFRTPMTLKEISWLTTSEGGPHNSVNVYIFALDENGEPTQQLLYSERAVMNEDEEWNTLTLPVPVEASNGAFVGINYPGFLAIGIDDASPEYPFRRHTYAFTSDYETPVFAYLDDKGLSSNLLIRATGVKYPDNATGTPAALTEPERKPDFRRYTVSRLTTKSASEADWTLLTSEPIEAEQFEDSSWSGLAPGIYAYAVKTVYPDGTVSSASLTPFLMHAMKTNVEVRAVTNSRSGSAKGAEVKLTSADGSVYTAVIKNGNSAIVKNVLKDQYTVSVSLEGYASSTAKEDFSLLDSYTTPEYLLDEIRRQPYNLSFEIKGEDDARQGMFHWNESGEIFDDFEAHSDFALESPGEVGWKYRDGDGGRTFAEQAFDFPGRTKPMSFMVFNPSATAPSMLEQRSVSKPYSGKKYLACFASVRGNDDWFISPRINYHSEFEFSFVAKRYSPTYAESFRVGWSATDTAPESFKWVSDNESPTQEWQHYSYRIPAEARFVAVHTDSPDGFVFMIDDVKISSGSGMPMQTAPSAPDVEYEVYVDGESIGRTSDTSFLLETIGEGKHKAAVKAIYNSGETALSEIEFNVAGSIGSVSAADVVEVIYFDMLGRRLDAPAPGTPCLRRIRYTDGHTVTERILLR